MYRRILEVRWQFPEVIQPFSLEQLMPAARSDAGSNGGQPDRRWAAPLGVLADALAPVSLETRRRLEESELYAYIEPRLRAIDGQIQRYQGALNHPVVDTKWVGDAATGRLVDITVSPATLTDQEQIQLDPNNARDHYYVKLLRGQLAALQEARISLERLKQSP